MKLKEIGIWGGIITLLIGGLWLLITAVNNSPSPTNPSTIKIPAISQTDFVNDPLLATGSAKITLVEYSDFQCPACKAYFPLVKQLEKDFKGQLLLVYRFFPLIQTHKNALISSQATYAASLQNKFWEMHDLLFENQDSWTNIDPKETFINYARDLKLDVEKFKKDLDTDTTKQFVTDSLNKGTEIGISYTPSFFLNGRLIQNPPSYDAFKILIQDELAK